MKESKVKITGQEGAAPAPKPGNYPKEYDEVSYDLICAALLRSWGIEGDVAEGARNTMYYKVVRDFRYICNFDVEFCVAVTPRWGLSEDEARQTATSAVASPRGTEIPSELTAAIAAAKKGEASPDDEDFTPDDNDTNPLPAKLPPIFSQIARRYKEYKKTAVLAALPAVGTLLTNLRSRYEDGEEQCPIFFVVVTAPQASGKSFARELSNRLTEPIREADGIAREKENEYKRELRAKKNTKQQPEDPKAVVRVLPSTVSNAMLLKRADYAAGKALYTFAEEIDTIARGNKAGSWSQKGDIYRMAFDGAEWGQDYMSETSYSGVVELHYNLLLLGTPMAVSRFFKFVEDGMASRFTLTSLPDTRGKMLAKRYRLPKIHEEKLTTLVNDAYAFGNGNLVHFMLPETLKKLAKWHEQRIAEYLQNPDNVAVDVLRRRAAVIGFRAAMLAWYLQGQKEDNVVTDFAIWVANEVLQQQLIMFGDRINEAEQANMLEAERQRKSGMNSRNVRLLDDLPDTFTISDVVSARHRAGENGSPYTVIHRWIKAGLVMKEPTGKSYLKIK